MILNYSPVLHPFDAARGGPVHILRSLYNLATLYIVRRIG
jgi:hypothetical protein